jgi:hypothetical protein
MTDRYEPPMASLGDIAAEHSALIRQDRADLSQEIQRMGLGDMIADIVKLKAGRIVYHVTERVEARPVPAILIALGLGILGGRLLRR